MKIAVQVAAAMGFLGVVLGAFGAHKLEEIVSFRQLEIWQTAVLYQLIHSVAALWAAERKPLVVWLWTAGVLLFSGSLYALTLTGITKLGMITPLGGLLFLAGWLVLVVKPPLGRIN
jgi:uncharacterized membrane protein YgdD (TMEM256/DUF423 family)